MNIRLGSRGFAAPALSGTLAALLLVVSPTAVSADHHAGEKAAVAEAAPAQADDAGKAKAAHCGCAQGYSQGGCGECNGQPAAPAEASAKVGEPDAEYERAPCGCLRKKSD